MQDGAARSGDGFAAQVFGSRQRRILGRENLEAPRRACEDAEDPERRAAGGGQEHAGGAGRGQELDVAGGKGVGLLGAVHENDVFHGQAEMLCEQPEPFLNHGGNVERRRDVGHGDFAVSARERSGERQQQRGGKLFQAPVHRRSPLCRAYWAISTRLPSGSRA